MTKSSPSNIFDKPGNMVIQVLPLFLLFFLVFMDHLMMVPLGASIAEDVGLAPERSGYLIAIYPLVAAISALVTAPFSDRWGRKKMLIILSGGFCLATFGCALSYNVYTIFAFRIISAMFGGPIMPNILAFTGDLFQGEQRTKAMTTVMLGFATSSILGVPFGAWTGDYFSWEAPFYIVAFATIFCIFGITHMRPAVTGIKPDKIFVQYLELFQLWNLKVVRNLFFAQFFMLVGLFGLIPNMGVWLTMNLGMSATQVGLCYMQGGIGGVIGNQLSGLMLKIFSKSNVVILGSTIMGFVLFLFTNIPFPAILAGLFMAGMMLGGSMRMPAFQLMLTESVPIYKRGRLMSMSMIVANISMGIGGLWSTPLLTIENEQLHGISIIGIVTLCMILIVVPLIYSVRERPAEVH